MNGAKILLLTCILYSCYFVTCTLYYTHIFSLFSLLYTYTVAIEELKWQTPTIAILPADVDLKQLTANATRTCHTSSVSACPNLIYLFPAKRMLSVFPLSGRLR